ncbi:hypothetical protein KEM54_003627 [Ascosphaera aggregata]|nr:hypothetical protein KEM54_003627 [Ascosphaera aggregata]
MESFQEELQEILSAHNHELWQLNLKIWSHPELSYKEVFAHDTICNYIEKLGYNVTRHAYGLETAFEASVQVGDMGEGGLLVYNAEYDALPEIGHACGHNLIASSSIAAFILTAKMMKKHVIPGCVRLLGTPAEEGGGGKIKLLKAGAFNNVDACMMGHPQAAQPNFAGIIAPSLIGAVHGKVTYHGFSAHAGNSPWLGKNALDAAVQAYNNLSMLRQQLEPTQRVQAIITNGGKAPNIIPDLTEMMVTVRAQRFTQMQETVERLNACLNAAAAATGCTVEVEWKEAYKELRANELIAARFAEYAKAFKQNYLTLNPQGSMGASTDQGNVSYEVPTLHPGYSIPVESPDIGNHHPGFTKASGTREAFDVTLDFALTLAATGLDVMKDAELRKDIHEKHKEMLKWLLEDN